MKLKTCTMVLCFSACYLVGAAQQTAFVLNEPDNSKPKLFNDLPEKMSLNLDQVENLFNVPVGNTVKAVAGSSFAIYGTVISRSIPPDHSAQTLLIKMSNRPGATFTLTKMTDGSGSVSYRGRIMSFANSDAFEVRKEGNEYFLIKKTLHDLMNE